MATDIADFTRGAKLAPETENAFKKFMGAADPLAISPDPSPSPPLSERLLEEAIRHVKEAPEKSYEERLREHHITLEDAHRIVDTIMTKGVYEKTYPLTSKSSVTFRSRNLQDQERTQAMLEEQVPQFMGTVNMIMAKHNLAASLVDLAGTKFGEGDQEIAKALKFVSKLPHVLFNVLITKLAHFDELVLTVMDEGAIENF